MALLAIFFGFGIVIALVIALPVLNGIGSYKANPDGRKIASQQLEEAEKRKRGGSSQATSSSSSAGFTGVFSRRAGGNGQATNPYEYNSPSYGQSDEDNEPESQSYTPFDYDQQTSPEDLSQSTGNVNLNKLRSKVSQTLRTKHNPLKFAPSAGAQIPKRTTLNTSSASSKNRGPVDATAPFSSNIDNEFDYDSFIEEQDKQDALDDQREARLAELSNRRNEEEREANQKLSTARLESLA